MSEEKTNIADDQSNNQDKQTIITETETMEIHHADLHHHKTKFKDYLIEFFMIFLAVTLGFFAENFREEQVNAHREKNFMISMLEDLRSDSTEITDAITFTSYMISGLDSLSDACYQYSGADDDPMLYRLNTTYLRLVGASYNDRTSAQLRSGGMSLIKNRNVANEIAKYWSALKSIEASQENYDKRIDKAAELAYTLFNLKYISAQKIDMETGASRVTVNPEARLLSTDEPTMINYANHIRSMRSILLNFYTKRLQKQLEECEKLKTLIREEYNLNG